MFLSETSCGTFSDLLHDLHGHRLKLDLPKSHLMKECLQINMQKLSVKEKRTKDMNRQATREKTPMANNREKMFNLIRNFKNNTGRSCFAYHIDKGLQHLGVQCHNPNLKLLENQTKPPKRDPSVYEFITKFLPLLGTLPSR